MTELRREVELLIRRVGHWGPPRWAAPAGTGGPGTTDGAGGPGGTSEAGGAGRTGGTRADAVHALVQRLADRCADVEGQPRRRVPRLDNDLALVDQLRVLAADLEAVGDAEALAAAAADTAETRTAL